jgi:hypothetical protein
VTVRAGHSPGVGQQLSRLMYVQGGVPGDFKASIGVRHGKRGVGVQNRVWIERGERRCAGERRLVSRPLHLSVRCIERESCDSTSSKQNEQRHEKGYDHNDRAGLISYSISNHLPFHLQLLDGILRPVARLPFEITTSSGKPGH